MADTRTRIWGSLCESRSYREEQLTLDGLSPLKPLKDGTFAAGDSILRFDAYAGKQPQRMNIDDTHLYRIELP